MLVSTSVVEEGIDVPACNLVVKFDFPTTFRSYIQSKGRARKSGSRYVLLIEEGDGDKMNQYQEWLDMYELSMKECHSKKIWQENQNEIMEVQEDYYCTSQARISGSQVKLIIGFFWNGKVDL